eukprot:1250553-Amphidinium_carterae.1
MDLCCAVLADQPGLGDGFLLAASVCHQASDSASTYKWARLCAGSRCADAGWREQRQAWQAAQSTSHSFTRLLFQQESARLLTCSSVPWRLLWSNLVPALS